MFYRDINKDFFASLDKVDSTLHIKDTFDTSAVMEENVHKKAFKFSDMLVKSNYSPTLNKHQSLTKNLKNLAYL